MSAYEACASRHLDNIGNQRPPFVQVEDNDA